MDFNSEKSFEIEVFSRWNLKKNEANRIIITGVMNKTKIVK